MIRECVRQKQVTVDETFYITSDGKEFNAEWKAEEHESFIKLYRLKSFNGWYKIESVEDLDIVLNYLNHIGKVRHSGLPHSYPDAVTWEVEHNDNWMDECYLEFLSDTYKGVHIDMSGLEINPTLCGW